MTKKTKYYYGEKLIRTSANGTYRYAVIDKRTNECKGCRSEYKAADAIVTGKINDLYEAVTNYTSAKNAADRGADRYGYRDGRRRGYRPVTESAETYAKWLQEVTEKINDVRENWLIVELEAK